MRKQLGTKNSKSKEGKQEKHGVVKREETGVQRSLTERLVRNRLQLAGHVERMADDRLPKRAAGGDEEGQCMLRWDDFLRETRGRQERRTGSKRQRRVEKTIR